MNSVLGYVPYRYFEIISEHDEPPEDEIYQKNRNGFEEMAPIPKPGPQGSFGPSRLFELLKKISRKGRHTVISGDYPDQPSA